MAIGIRFSNVTRSTVISSSPTTFHGIQITNISASGVTCVVSDSATAGTTEPYAMFFVAKSGSSIPIIPFLNKGVRMNNGIWFQLLGGGKGVAGVTATVYHGG